MRYAEPMSEQLTPVRIVSMTYEASDILSFIVEREDGKPLPPVDPGSHIDIHLPNGLVRSYSISNNILRSKGYRLTVARDAASTGGSVYMHEQLRPGQTLRISPARNNFSLEESAPLSVFIAGGIGITPFLPMMARLNELGRKWRLHYCVRTQNRAALLGEIKLLAAEGDAEICTNFDEEPGGKMLDLSAVISSLSPSAHVYCCGPTGMLDAFRRSVESAQIEPQRVHFEYFSGNVEIANEGGFTVKLARSNKTLVIGPNQTILKVVMEAGVDVPYSCEEGVCGACETKIISGTPDHRDLILSDAERAEGRTMMICCSGSKSAELVLDL